MPATKRGTSAETARGSHLRGTPQGRSRETKTAGSRGAPEPKHQSPPSEEECATDETTEELSVRLKKNESRTVIDIAVNTVPVTDLVTSGVTYTMVDQEVAKRLGVTFEPKTMTVQAASGNTTEALGLSWWRYKWFGAVKTMQIVICPELRHGVLLGNGFLVDNRIRVNPMEKALEIVQDGKLRAIGPDELQFISFSSRPDVTGSANKMHESVPQKGWPTDGTTAQGTGGPAKSCAQMERQEVLHGFNVRDKDRVIRVMMRTKAKSISANASDVVTRITCGDADDDSEDETAIHECYQLEV